MSRVPVRRRRDARWRTVARRPRGAQRRKAARWPGLTALLLALLLAALPLSGCGRAEYASVTVFAMDTTITVQIDASQPNAAALLGECERTLYELDALLSRTREGSDVWKINHALVTEGLSEHTVRVLRTALMVSERTGGAFDVTVAPLIELWEACRDRGSVPRADELSAALALVGYEQLTLEDSTLTKAREDVRIDLGGIAKGYAADVLAEYLEAEGVEYGIVSFGSCIVTVGQKPDGAPYRIALRDPADAAGTIGYVSLTGGVLSVTGDYERGYDIAGEQYHHVLSPTTGYPATSVWHSVAVICESGAVADAVSTALFVLGDREAAYAEWQGTELAFEGVFTGDAGTEITDGMGGSFVSQKH